MSRTAARGLALLPLAALLALAAGCSRGPRQAGAVVELPSASPVVALRASFHAGSIHDPPGKEGLSALTARLMVEGGTKDLSYRELLARLYPLAGTITAVADKELVTIAGEVPAGHVAEFYPLFRDVLVAPRWDASDFERVRANMLSYLQTTLRSSDDEMLARRTLELMLFEDHPYGHLAEGTVAGLRAITLADVRAFHAAQFRAANAVVGVAGAYPDELPDALDGDLATLPEGAPEDTELIAPARVGATEIAIVEKPGAGTTIAFGFPVDVRRGDVDYYPLLLATSWLGEHRTPYGRLFQELREERGLNYGDYAYLEHFQEEPGTRFPQAGRPRRYQYFSVWIRPVGDAARVFALKAALRELDRLVGHGIPEDELAAQAEFLRNSSRLVAQGPSRRLGFAFDDLFYGVGDSLRRLDDGLARVTRDQLVAALARHIRPDHVKIAIVTERGEELRQQLLSGQALPIEYPDGGPAELAERDREYAAWPIVVTAPLVHVVRAEELFQTATLPWHRRR
ncbi:MAG: insulinase family protein [Acidobacteria bacterium]|nr:insulinase family protein [Acidobacteriota bacterium]